MYAVCLEPDSVILFKVSSFVALLLLSLAFTTTFNGKNTLAQVAYQKNSKSSSPSSRLLTYQNITAGFKIHYPSYWQKFENSTSDSSGIYFVEPLSGARFTVASFRIPQANLSNEPKNLILSTYLNGFIQPFQLYNNTQSTITTLAGNPANKTELTYFYSGHPARTTIWSSLIGNKVYILSYAASKANYALFLPTAQEMINSFSILPAVAGTSAASSTNLDRSSNTQ